MSRGVVSHEDLVQIGIRAAGCGPTPAGVGSRRDHGPAGLTAERGTNGVKEERVRLFCDAALARRLDEALTKEGAAYVDAWQHARPDSGAAKEWVAGGCVLFTGVDSPVTQAVGLGREGPVSAGDVDRVESFFRDRGAVSRINLSPFAHPSLALELGDRGYRVEEFENALVRTLASDDRFGAPAPWVAVREVGDEDDVLWAPLIARAFSSGAPEGRVSGMALTLAQVALAIDDATAFLGEIGGVPAGGGSLSLHDGIATMFGDATLSEWRGHSVQISLLRARLSRAVEAGCDLAAAGASPGSSSQRNMERLGFRVAYTQVMMTAGRWNRSGLDDGGSSLVAWHAPC
ncbi:MAG: hypothetical protein ACYC5Q_13220 [Thermoleophilia bacterium]